MKLFLYIFCFFSLLTYSQKEHHKWYFGSKAGLDFSSGTPLSVANGTMTSYEGCVSFSDTSGNLLFYSNGSIVWNKNHSIMDNGNGLMGDPSTTQSCFVVKKQGANSSLYYLFTLGQLGTGSLGYSIIDMSLAAGLGSVTVKNDTLAKDMTEKLHGTLHCNGKDTWVVGHKCNSNDFYSYLVTAAGVNSVPVISTVGSMHAVTNGTVYGCIGTMKFSSTGKKLGVAIAGSNILDILDFNPSTGQISNNLILSANLSNRNFYGCEFSPDGSKFYAHASLLNSQRELHQWDVCAGSHQAIIGSHQIISGVTTTATGHHGALQLAPDGKIYSAFFAKPYISVINNPNNSGSACNFVEQGFNLIQTVNSSALGLPNHISSYYRPKAQINATSSNSCGVVSFSFTPPAYLCAQASNSVNSVLWQFNDPGSVTNTSSANNPLHTYSQNGNYTVTLVVTYDCYADTLKQVISVSGLPAITVSGKQTICKGEKTSLSLSGASSYSVNGTSSSSTFTAQPIANTVYTLSATGTGTDLCISQKTVSISVLPCAGFTTLNQQAGDIKIYPNPSTGIFILESPANSSITLTDISGRVLLTKTLSTIKNDIDLSAQSKGIYFIQVRSPEGLFTFKLVKE